VTALAIDASSRVLASGGKDRSIKIWRLDDLENIQDMMGHSEPVSALAFTPDGRRLVSGSWDKTVRLWDLDSGQPLATFFGHSDWVRAVAPSPNGELVLSASQDCLLKAWDLSKARAPLREAAHRDRVAGVAITPDGRTALSVSWDGRLIVWDAATARERLNVRAHEHGVSAVAVLPGDEIAVSGSDSRELKVWDIATGKESLTFKGHSLAVSGVVALSDGRHVVSSAYEAFDDIEMGDAIRIWDSSSGRELAALHGPRDRQVEAKQLVADPAGRRVAVTEGSTLHVWDLETRRLVLTLESQGQTWFMSLALTSTLVLTGDSDGTISTWRLAGGERLRTRKAHASEITALCVTPDERLVASASRDTSVRLWDLTTDECVARFDAENGIRCLALSADGRLVVAGDDAGQVHFFRLEAGEMAASSRRREG
jgi:WD40 repeat protein